MYEDVDFKMHASLSPPPPATCMPVCICKGKAIRLQTLRIPGG
jgi:hypothetical protein